MANWFKKLLGIKDSTQEEKQSVPDNQFNNIQPKAEMPVAPEETPENAEEASFKQEKKEEDYNQTNDSASEFERKTE
jgi:hypothetical protein